MMAAESMTGAEAIETGVTSLARLFFRAFHALLKGVWMGGRLSGSQHGKWPVES